MLLMKLRGLLLQELFTLDDEEEQQDQEGDEAGGKETSVAQVDISLRQIFQSFARYLVVKPDGWKFIHLGRF